MSRPVMNIVANLPTLKKHEYHCDSQQNSNQLQSYVTFNNTRIYFKHQCLNLT
jgi:hypothetical protein